MKKVTADVAQVGRAAKIQMAKIDALTAKLEKIRAKERLIVEEIQKVSSAEYLASVEPTRARDLPYDVIIGPGTASWTKRHNLLLIGETMLRGKEKSTTLYTLDLPKQMERPA